MINDKMIMKLHMKPENYNNKSKEWNCDDLKKI